MPTDPDYLESLGRAMYRWAQMEWAIVYLAEELHSEGRKAHRSASMTSVLAARRLQSALGETKVSDSAYMDAKAISEEYGELVRRRNEIVHAHPATIKDEHRLHRVLADGTHELIDLDDLVAFSSECARLGSRASALLWALRRGEAR